jgi:hypothetical protein
MDLHAHLVDRHPDRVTIGRDETDDRIFFEMSCPLCGEHVKQPLKKRASLLQGYEREIRLVAFDLLLYHVQEKHS